MLFKLVPFSGALVSILLLVLPYEAVADPNCEIKVSDDEIRITAGDIERVLRSNGTAVSTTSISVDGVALLAGPAGECSVTFTRANPNRRPVGLRPGESVAVEQRESIADGTDSLEVTDGTAAAGSGGVAWVEPITVRGNEWQGVFDSVSWDVRSTGDREASKQQPAYPECARKSVYRRTVPGIAGTSCPPVVKGDRPKAEGVPVRNLSPSPQPSPLRVRGQVVLLRNLSPSPQPSPSRERGQVVLLRNLSPSPQPSPSRERELVGALASGSTHLAVCLRASKGPLAGVSLILHYEVYDGYPVVRKWVEIANDGTLWRKIENLVIDDIELSPEYSHQTALTPAERGALSSIIGFGSRDGGRGVIAVSEIPSALRAMHPTGATGYASEHFEWVLGPGERFVSEPVFLYAFSGEVTNTISGVSTPLDRAVEGQFQRFLEEHIGVLADPANVPAPLWCSWSNFGPAVNEAILREQAEVAAKAGFECLQVDAGWARCGAPGAWGSQGTSPDKDKFPDFGATCRYVRSLGLRLGLWVSTFRAEDSEDLAAVPNARSLPEIKRANGVGMSFSSPWRDYYARDLARLHKQFGASYVKQDLTSIKFGDIAEGHESRTRKESLLRGLRGLLDSQDTLHRLAPEVWTELTHEIYWGTPGTPCDVAAVKHACSFHVPPNDYAGCGNRNQRPNAGWTYDPDALGKQLIAGCAHARDRFYAHRGLPLYCIEYYGAATVNFKGSLTPEIQDRQVCSWLMGAPMVYAGDLASLSGENIRHYRRRFDLVKRLRKQYDIYRHFQYSGVPSPTDTDWHWWGKLNDGQGAVVVMRGSEGEARRRINVPWVHADRRYRVTALFAERSLGIYTGKQLRDGILSLSLPAYGQEILEVSQVTE